MKRFASIVVGLSLAFVGTSTTMAATIDVPGDYPTIQGAIDASVNGDVINIAPGTYNEHSLSPSGKAITIQGTLNGDGTLATTIDAQQDGSVFLIISGETYENLMIKDLVITGGSYFYGGGVGGSLSTMSSATIDGCTVTGNEGGFGGGIFASADNVINDCTIENNLALASGGGIYCLSSQNTITNCTVEDNTAVSEGGGIYSYGFGELLISGCTITGNTCQDDGEGGGAGIRGYLGDTTIIDCTISDNTAASVGGGIMTSSTTTISGCKISDNTGGFGGGLYSVSTHLITISSTVVCGNTSGQIYFDDWIDGGDNCVQDSCEDCIVIRNVPDDYPTIQGAIDASLDGDVIDIAPGTYNEHSLNPSGKAITIQGTLNGDGTLATTIDAQQAGSVFVVQSSEGSGTVIQLLAITGGSTTRGGGIFCDKGSSPTISGCMISDNTADNGGGVYCRSGNPIITGCTIESNTAYSGGGVYSYIGIPTISGCMILDNTADYGGGGIYLLGSPVISGCTISGNSAGVFGGGIAGLGNSNPTISDSQICGNEANQISGGYADAGGNSVADECPEECLGDLDSDGSVGVDDLLILLADFGTDCSGGCVSDLDSNGEVTVDDLLSLLGAYGTNCP